MARTRTQIAAAQADLAARLEPFRGTEPTAGIVLAASDPQAVRVLASWTLFEPPEWSKPRGRAPVDPRHLWHWLWGPVWERMDWKAFAEATGMLPPTCALKMTLCVHARMAYPDGSIANAATRLLEHVAASKLPKPKRKPKKKAKE